MKWRRRTSSMIPDVPMASIDVNKLASSSRVTKSSSPLATTSDVSPPPSFVLSSRPGDGLIVEALLVCDVDVFLNGYPAREGRKHANAVRGRCEFVVNTKRSLVGLSIVPFRRAGGT